ncbi:MAG: class I SAM-dependent methyltransferase [Phycisphaerales bacterium]|nr:class I SAM-dependent methyltransferase [Phycisphaerales bacterium]
MTEPTPPDRQPDRPTSEPARKPHEFAATRDWPGYFEAVAGTGPRETLLRALEIFVPPIDPDAPPLAIDLGCGEGRDTQHLLGLGWRVLAIDGHPDAIRRIREIRRLADNPRLTLLELPFESVEQLPACDLLNSSFSLPFCPPEHFARLWAELLAAMKPGAIFAGQLFGDRDDWASLPDRAHHTRDQALDLLKDFDIDMFKEEERDGEDASGTPKHWHVFHIVARKR